MSYSVLAKASEKASPESGGREADPLSWWKQLQNHVVRNAVRGRWRILAIFAICSLICQAPRLTWAPSCSYRTFTYFHMAPGIEAAGERDTGDLCISFPRFHPVSDTRCVLSHLSQHQSHGLHLTAKWQNHESMEYLVGITVSATVSHLQTYLIIHKTSVRKVEGQIRIALVKE